MVSNAMLPSMHLSWKCTAFPATQTSSCNISADVSHEHEKTRKRAGETNTKTRRWNLQVQKKTDELSIKNNAKLQCQQ